MVKKNKVLTSALRKVKESKSGGCCEKWSRVPGSPLTKEEKKEFLDYRRKRIEMARARRQARVHERLNAVDRMEDRGFIISGRGLSDL